MGGNDSFMHDIVNVPIGDGDKLSFLISKEKQFTDQKLWIEDNPCPDYGHSNKKTTLSQ